MSTEQIFAEQILADLNDSSLRHQFSDWIEEQWATSGYDRGVEENEDARIKMLRQDGGIYFITLAEKGRDSYKDKKCLWYSSDRVNATVVGPLDDLPMCHHCGLRVEGHLFTVRNSKELACGSDECQRRLKGDHPEQVFGKFQGAR